MKYVVTYLIDRYLRREDGIYENKPEGRTLIVQGDSQVQAFVAAYGQLTAQGLMVCTVSGMALREYDPDDNETIYNETIDWAYAGLTSAEMEEVYKAGVPKTRADSNVSMTHIEEIREFAFTDTPSQFASPALQAAEYLARFESADKPIVNQTPTTPSPAPTDTPKITSWTRDQKIAFATFVVTALGVFITILALLSQGTIPNPISAEPTLTPTLVPPTP